MSSNDLLPNRVPYSFGPLYDLLRERFPDNRSKQRLFDIPGLAKDMDLSHETLYRAVRTSQVKQRIVIRILEFSHQRHPEMPLYWEDLAQYVLPGCRKYSRAS